MLEQPWVCILTPVVWFSTGERCGIRGVVAVYDATVYAVLDNQFKDLWTLKVIHLPAAFAVPGFLKLPSKAKLYF
jgi:hypothetical protein